jgi:hypothetical protein
VAVAKKYKHRSRSNDSVTKVTFLQSGNGLRFRQCEYSLYLLMLAILHLKCAAPSFVSLFKAKGLGIDLEPFRSLHETEIANPI